MEPVEPITFVVVDQLVLTSAVFVFLVFLVSLLSGCQRVFPQTARLARGCLSAGCQWKVGPAASSSHAHMDYASAIVLFYTHETWQY